jgi:2-polyprenyl-3-methyl-5-hydroxy-6-metoxy-1,4-benzoquinol methylase
MRGNHLKGIDFVQKLPKVRLLDSRDDFILNQCKGKNVLDLGCVKSGLTVESFNKRDLLHLKIRKVAENVIGVDNDKEGIEFLVKQGTPNLICLDVQEIDKLQLYLPIDVIVAGEIIEHLANPGLCLKGILRFMKPNDTTLIVTVPNAFSFHSFLSVAIKRAELVMPDHNFYFSYRTLHSLLHRHGFRILKLQPYYDVRTPSSSVKRLIKGFLARTLYRICPWCAEGIIAVANKL